MHEELKVPRDIVDTCREINNWWPGESDDSKRLHWLAIKLVLHINSALTARESERVLTDAEHGRIADAYHTLRDNHYTKDHEAVVLLLEAMNGASPERRKSALTAPQVEHKIVTGLRDAVAYANGDKSKGVESIPQATTLGKECADTDHDWYQNERGTYLCRKCPAWSSGAAPQAETCEHVNWKLDSSGGRHCLRCGGAVPLAWHFEYDGDGKYRTVSKRPWKRNDGTTTPERGDVVDRRKSPYGYTDVVNDGQTKRTSLSPKGRRKDDRARWMVQETPQVAWFTPVREAVYQEFWAKQGRMSNSPITLADFETLADLLDRRSAVK